MFNLIKESTEIKITKANKLLRENKGVLPYEKNKWIIGELKIPGKREISATAFYLVSAGIAYKQKYFSLAALLLIHTALYANIKVFQFIVLNERLNPIQEHDHFSLVQKKVILKIQYTRFTVIYLLPIVIYVNQKKSLCI